LFEENLQILERRKYFTGNLFFSYFPFRKEVVVVKTYYII